MIRLGSPWLRRPPVAPGKARAARRFLPAAGGTAARPSREFTTALDALGRAVAATHREVP